MSKKMSIYHKEGINEKKTIKAAKDFLCEYNFWYLQSMRINKFKDLKYEELPTTINPPVQTAKIELECMLRLKTIALMKEDSETTSLLGDILECRYIKGFAVIKTCQLLSLSERTYARLLNEALLTFALVCPLNLIHYGD